MRPSPRQIQRLDWIKFIVLLALSVLLVILLVAANSAGAPIV